ncbi:MAG: hypothetical protein OEM38_02465 [Gammaproteobacteria bacterium]|nr:hypothetical protein [Gammaproteobacteria bacterium]
MKRTIATLFLCLFLVGSAIAANHMASDRISDIRNTKHNFASDDFPQLPVGTRDVKSLTENQVCVFCHTPHGAPLKAAKPFLWNRTDSAAGMTFKYTSTTLNINNNSVALGDKSKMCLSCHDGTVAIGQVDMNGSQTKTSSTVPTPITMTGGNNVDSVTGKLIAGNALIGSDFRNDHPVGFSYDNALVTADPELIDPASVSYMGVRASRKVTSHNQQIVIDGGAAGTDNPVTVSTRISVPLEATVTAPANGQSTFVSVATSGQVECTTCHDPHIRSTNVNENIKFLRLRRFQQTDPDGAAFNIDNDINCLACHKKTGWEDSVHGSELDASHTFTAAEVTARDISTGKQIWQASCLACHDTHTVDGASWLLRQASDVGNEVSDVDKSCFKCHSSTGVINSQSPAVSDIESISITGGHAGADPLFVFTDGAHKPNQASAVIKEAATEIVTRHAGCTDCHNPHQMQKGLHVNAGLPTNNNVSGALKGVDGLAATGSGGFDPFVAEDPPTEKIADKEYEICFKCHSSYGHGVGKIGTAVGQFSNTVKEFSDTSSAHPVVAKTGNITLDEGLMESPFNGANVLGVSGVGEQTMYCSDCHTNTGGTGTPVLPQGSHNADIAACETCHVSDQYLTAGITPIQSSFACAVPGDCPNSGVTGLANLHIYHATQTVGGVHACANCHVKIPHGWRRRGLLADTSDTLGPNNDSAAMAAKYYPAALADVVDTLPASASWKKTDCTNAGCHL